MYELLQKTIQEHSHFCPTTQLPFKTLSTHASMRIFVLVGQKPHHSANGYKR